MMRYRALGKTGIAVSELGFGCGSVGGLMIRGEPEDQREVIAKALDAGVTYFDTAQAYGDGGSEENLGRTLKELDAWGQVVVGTKQRLTLRDLASPVSAIRDSLKTSLRRLGRDSVDLLQLHSRIRTSPSDEEGLPPRETADAVADAMRVVVKEGLVRHIGFTGLGDTDAVQKVIESGRFDTVQIYVNALNPSAAFPGASGGAQDLQGMIGAAAEQGSGVIAIRVLAAGAITGSSERAELASPMGVGAMVTGGDFEADVWRAQGLAVLAEELELESSVEMGLRFVIGIEGISTVVVGFSDLTQLEDALRWSERGPLDASAAERIVELAGATS